MYNINSTTNTNEIFVVAVYTDTVSSVAEKKISMSLILKRCFKLNFLNKSRLTHSFNCVD